MSEEIRNNFISMQIRIKKDEYEIKELRTRVAELENENMGKDRLLMRLDNDLSLSKKRVAELTETINQVLQFSGTQNNELLLKRVAELEGKYEKAIDGFNFQLDMRVKSDKKNAELQNRLSTLEAMKIDAEKRWDEISESLQTRLSTLLKASEGMEKALGMVMKANHIDVRKPSEECLKEHFVILLPTEDDEDIKQILADFRAVKEATSGR